MADEVSMQYRGTSIVNPCGTEVGGFRSNLVNTLAVDVLAPYVARPSAAMILALWDTYILVFHKDMFAVPAPPQCWEMQISFYASQNKPNKVENNNLPINIADGCSVRCAVDNNEANPKKCHKAKGWHGSFSELIGQAEYPDTMLPYIPREVMGWRTKGVTNWSYRALWTLSSLCTFKNMRESYSYTKHYSYDSYPLEK